MEKKKIDFYCGTFLTGGIETTLIQLLKNINPELFTLRLIILYKTPKQELLLSQVPTYVEIVYIVSSEILNSIRARRLKERIPIYYKLIEEVLLLNIRRMVFQFNIRRELKNVDIVIDYGMCLMNFPKLIKHKKTVIYNHFSLNHINRTNSKKNRKQIDNLLNYSKIIAICDEMIEQFATFHPNYIDKIVRIYNYVNGAEIQLKAKEGKIAYTGPYILAIGRLDETQKDYMTLLKGFAIAKLNYKIEQNLVILGQGRDKEKLEKLSKDLNISEFVHFAGFDSNPFKWLAQCDFFVHSSKFEGLPTVLVEAMILDKNIIASACPTGVRELLSNGKAGYLFDVGNFNELSIHLKTLAANPDFTEDLKKERQLVLEQFSHQHTIAKLENEIFKLSST